MTRQLFPTSKIYFFVAIFMLSIAPSPTYSQSKELIAKIEDNNGYYSLKVPLEKYQKEKDGWKVEGAGVLDGKSVKLRCNITHHSVIEEGMGEYSVFFDFSEESAKNAMLAFIQKVATKPSKKIKESHLFEAVGVVDEGNLTDGFPRKYELENLHDQVNYGEWYLSVDPEIGMVTFSEKNQMYREPLIATLLISE